MERRKIRPAARAGGEVRLPGSKSVTNRYLNLALLARRPVVIERPLFSDDPLAFVGALRAVGLTVSGTQRLLTVGVGEQREGGSIDCGASGTMLRFLVASLTTLPGTWTLDGTQRLRERPVGDLVRAMRALGARIDCLGEEGFAPLRIVGGQLRGGRVEIEASASSQFVSAVMMASIRATDQVTIKARRLVSAPYVEMTRRALEQWGGRVGVAKDGVLSVRPAALEGGRFVVEGDYSSACYLAAGAALLGGSVRLLGLEPRSAQGDKAFFEVLSRMGAAVEWDEGVIEITSSGRLEGVDCSMANMPDQVPTLAALAPFARGVTRIRAAAHLRLKESDRWSVMARGLRTAGAEVEEQEDGLLIPGVWSETEPPARRILIDTADDHRIAMSFAVLGLKRNGVEIAYPGVVEKSYPRFWRDFSHCFEAR